MMTASSTLSFQTYYNYSSPDDYLALSTFLSIDFLVLLDTEFYHLLVASAKMLVLSVCRQHVNNFIWF